MARGRCVLSAGRSGQQPLPRSSWWPPCCPECRPPFPARTPSPVQVRVWLSPSWAAKADRICVQLAPCLVRPRGHQSLFLDCGHACPQRHLPSSGCLPGLWEAGDGPGRMGGTGEHDGQGPGDRPLGRRGSPQGHSPGLPSRPGRHAVRGQTQALSTLGACWAPRHLHLVFPLVVWPEEPKNRKNSSQDNAALLCSSGDRSGPLTTRPPWRAAGRRPPSGKRRSWHGREPPAGPRGVSTLPRGCRLRKPLGDPEVAGRLARELPVPSVTSLAAERPRPESASSTWPLGTGPETPGLDPQNRTVFTSGGQCLTAALGRGQRVGRPLSAASPAAPLAGRVVRPGLLPPWTGE